MVGKMKLAPGVPGASFEGHAGENGFMEIAS
jgi:hypothetical protein